jgi:hypothetical protein
MLVYHYCSLESLNSILKHRALRLTNILKGSCMIRKLGLENILRSFSLSERILQLPGKCEIIKIMSIYGMGENDHDRNCN